MYFWQSEDDHIANIKFVYHFRNGVIAAVHGVKGRYERK